MWNLFVLLLIWLSELLLRPKCWLFERKIWQAWDSILLRLKCCLFERENWQVWDSNPRTHSCTRSLKGKFLESGALDRSAILPWVYRTCFILSSITPSCNVKSASSGSWFDSQKNCFDQNVGFLERKIWREWDSILLRLNCCLFRTQNLTGVDSNPRTHSCTRSLKGEFLESGALDRSSILPWVYRTCFILSSITPSCYVESVCLASHLTLRTPAFTKMLAFWMQNLTGVGFDTASIKMLPFWTRKLTGVGFEPTHTFVYQKSQRRISWVWRLRPLGHPALSISHLLHPVFDNTFL